MFSNETFNGNKILDDAVLLHQRRVGLQYSHHWNLISGLLSLDTTVNHEDFDDVKTKTTQVLFQVQIKTKQKSSLAINL